MEINIHNFQNEIRKLSFNVGNYKTNIPYITVYRFTNKKIQMPKIDNPYLYIVLDGILRLHTPSGMIDYMPGQYFISKIDSPLFGTVLVFSEK